MLVVPLFCVLFSFLLGLPNVVDQAILVINPLLVFQGARHEVVFLKYFSKGTFFERAGNNTHSF